MSTLCGELTHRPPNHYWVQHPTRKRYMPHEGDNIVAIIEDRQGDYYKAEIRSGALAYLPRLAFDGATKRNRPDLKRGIYSYIHAYLYAYLHTYMCSYIHVLIHTYAHTYTHTHTHIYTLTYTHTHTKLLYVQTYMDQKVLFFVQR